MIKDSDFQSQVIETFKAELEEQLQIISDGLLKLERTDDQSEDFLTIITEMFRAAHNIKGSARGISALDVGEISHHVETIFLSIQKHKIKVSKEIIDLCLQSVDLMREAMESFSNNAPTSFDLPGFLQSLKVAAEGPKAEAVKTEAATPAPKLADSEFAKQMIEAFSAELEDRLKTISNSLDELAKDSISAPDIEKHQEEIFRAAHTIGGTAAGIDIGDVSLIARKIEAIFGALKRKEITLTADLLNLIRQAVDGIRDAMDCFVQMHPISFDLKSLLTELDTETPTKTEQPSAAPAQPTQAPAAIAPPPKATEGAPTTTKAAAAKSSEHESIRVSLHNLDRVSAYMEEMQISKIAIDDHYLELEKLVNRLKQFTLTWKKNYTDFKNIFAGEFADSFRKMYLLNTEKLTDINNVAMNIHKNLNSHINELTIVSNALQEEVRVLRLVPTNTLLRHLPRTVRDLAFSLKKNVDLEIKDNDSIIDKIVLEGIKDPIIHILRNAIDHGIEDAATRKAAGKPETGHIKIDVQEESNHVIFSIKDDGAGIDVKKLAAAALRKNLITKAEVEILSDDDILEFLYLPGFSTKETVTDVSGRGVGLDVVKSNLANLKGSVSLSTELGKGTTFELRVPLTLATERGLIIKCAGQLFVVPTGAVERVLLLKKSEVIDVEGSQAILLDKHPISLTSLADVLDVKGASYEISNQIPVVVIKKASKTTALVVDEIIGEREIVIKPLQSPVNKVSCIAGATLSGSGEIILVLNLTDLIEKALRVKKVLVMTERKGATKTAESKPNVLVVDDSPTTRAFMRNILETNGFNVSTANDGLEAWNQMQRERFAALVTDVQMPNLDGFELTERVKGSASFHDVPVVIVTSLDSDEQRKRGLQVGADAYIVKGSFESDELVRIVKQLV